MTVSDYPYIWLKGEEKIGIRAAHPDYNSGVSLLTLSRDKIEIVRKR
jgi:hypothetical protein